jgi:hypothetical protein
MNEKIIYILLMIVGIASFDKGLVKIRMSIFHQYSKSLKKYFVVFF